jgi:hypothetical protein
MSEKCKHRPIKNQRKIWLDAAPWLSLSYTYHRLNAFTAFSAFKKTEKASGEIYAGTHHQL